MCDVSGDDALVWNETWRKARKKHSCDECGVAILPGSRYQGISGISSEREPFSMHLHEGCAEMWVYLIKIVCGGHGMKLVGGLEEDLRSHDEELTIWTEGDPEPGENWLLNVYHRMVDEYEKTARANDATMGAT